MEGDAVIEALTSEEDKVVDRQRGSLSEKVDDDVSFVRMDSSAVVLARINGERWC